MNYLHWISGLIVLAEALNKLERCTPFARGLTRYARVVDLLKALAWASLALGAGGAVSKPILTLLGTTHIPKFLIDTPTIANTAILFGFAVLIIRTRVREIEGHTVFEIHGTDTSPDKLAERQ